MGSQRTVSSFVSVAGLAVSWVIGAALLWWGNRTGTHDPACATYGTVCAGDLRFMLCYLSAEVVGLALVLRVWSSALLWRRTRALWQAILVLIVLSYPITMHQGAVSTMHLRWLVLVGGAAFLVSRRDQRALVA